MRKRIYKFKIIKSLYNELLDNCLYNKRKFCQNEELFNIYKDTRANSLGYIIQNLTTPSLLSNRRNLAERSRHIIQVP